MWSWRPDIRSFADDLMLVSTSMIVLLAFVLLVDLLLK